MPTRGEPWRRGRRVGHVRRPRQRHQKPGPSGTTASHTDTSTPGPRRGDSNPRFSFVLLVGAHRERPISTSRGRCLGSTVVEQWVGRQKGSWIFSTVLQEQELYELLSTVYEERQEEERSLHRLPDEGVPPQDEGYRECVRLLDGHDEHDVHHHVLDDLGRRPRSRVESPTETFY